MNISKVKKAGSILIKGTLNQQEVIQKELSSQQIPYRIALHENYSPKEDVVVLYALGKKDISGLRKYLIELKKVLNKTEEQRSQILDEFKDGNYDSFLELIFARSKHYQTRIGEFVNIPQKTLPADLVLDSLKNKGFRSLITNAKSEKPFLTKA